jgi:aspartyl-tRNA(Asn)/glutamyl-tRNA(Gln) amidotransferase subunit B
MNAKALELAATAGLALGSRVNHRSLFSRKNYFYPDLPNGFQTSQLDPPICEGGELEIEGEDKNPKIVHLNRIHLEDDAGKCIHDERRGISLVDLNRAGTPLIEIVTEPDLSSSGEAVRFLKKLHSQLVRLGVTTGRMEEGEFRCDVNISLRPVGSKTLGVRGEIKNLNSFRFVGQAIEYEITRQTALYQKGEPVLQETLHFDSTKGETRSLRSKEEAHDYRYFPQPDLPPVRVSEALLENLKASLPESPEKAVLRLSGLGLREDQALFLVEREGALPYFDLAWKFFPDPGRIFSLLEEFFLPLAAKEGIPPMSAPFGPELLAKLGQLLSEGKIGRRSVQEVFPELFSAGKDPEALMKERGMAQIQDEGAILNLVREVVEKHPGEVKKFMEGQEKILSFLVGQVMKLSAGRAEPKKAGELIRNFIKTGGKGQ